MEKMNPKKKNVEKIGVFRAKFLRKSLYSLSYFLIPLFRYFYFSGTHRYENFTRTRVRV
jgi:hypothetical protein